MNRTRISRRTFVQGAAGVVSLAAVAACASDNKTAGTSASSEVAATIGLQPETPATAAPVPVETQPATTPAPAPGSPAQYIDHGPETVNNVALTFHLSGDWKIASHLLDLLRDRATAVTVFIVGTFANDNPKLTARIVAEGHELANHTQNHHPMRTLSRSQIADEITKGGESITPFIGNQGHWFRPSGIVVPTDTILEEAGKAGYQVSVGYSLDTDDYQDPGAKHVLAKVRDEAKAGSIISVHFGHQGTIDAMPNILDHLSSVGLTPVTVSTLLA